MDCRLLVVSDGKSFILDSIISGLGEEGIQCAVSYPQVKVLEKDKNEADMILLFINGDAADMSDALVYIKDICVDDGLTLYLAGSADALGRIGRMIPGELVKAEFTRPFDVKKLVKDIASDAVKIVENGKAKKILVVDDDITYLKMIRKWLMDKYQVTVVKSGIQAIKYIAGHRPDLILMDYDMPVTTGSKVLEMIRSEPDSADIPVIFLTGMADRETVMKVMSLKPQGYFLKSMPKEELVASLDRFFETSKWQNVAGFS